VKLQVRIDEDGLYFVDQEDGDEYFLGPFDVKEVITELEQARLRFNLKGEEQTAEFEAIPE
jgi:hypothetical protein